MRNRTNGCLAILAVALFAANHLAAQTTRNVPSPAYPTVQSAIAAVQAGDTVLVAPGVYQENLSIPQIDFVFKGAGVGVSTIDGGGQGSCITIQSNVSNAMVIEGFTLTNGSGTLFSPNGIGSPYPCGGGIFMLGSTALNSFPEPTLRDLEITGNYCGEGAAIFMQRPHSPVLERLWIHSNGGIAGQPPANVIFIQVSQLGTLMRSCVIENEVVSNSAIQGGSVAYMSFEDCTFQSLSSTTGPSCINGITYSSGYPAADAQHMVRCRFLDNVALATTQNLPSVTTYIPKTSDCLFARNIGGQSVYGWGSEELVGCSFIDNVLNNAPLSSVVPNLNGSFVNCLIIGNTLAGGATAPPYWLTLPVGYNPTWYFVATEGNCLLERPGMTIPSAMFVNSSVGDYHVLPGSPLIDAGTVLTQRPLELSDLDGENRLRGASVDIGCYESQSIASSPVAAGRVGEFSGGPFDVLLINGSSGGPFRTVEVPVGSSSVVDLLQPPNLASPAQFSVFGLLGRAELEYVINVPYGVGDMGFAPAPMFPWYQTFLFTYASSVGTLNGVTPFLPAWPTPWTSGAGPGIPFPLTLTFQGVIEEAPGVFVPTNLIVFEVK